MASAGNHRYAKALVFEQTNDYNSGESNTLVCNNGILYFNGKQLSSNAGNQFDIFTANVITRTSGANIRLESNLVILPYTATIIDPSNSAGQGFQSDGTFLYYNGIQISAFSNIYQDADQLTSNSITPLGNTSFVVHSNLIVDNVMSANTQTITFASKTLHFSNINSPQITFDSTNFNLQPTSNGTNVQFLGAKNGSGSDCNVNFVSTASSNSAGSDVVNLKFKNKGDSSSPNANHTVASIRSAQSTTFNAIRGGGTMSFTCRDTNEDGTTLTDTQKIMIHMNTHTTANTILMAPDTDTSVKIGIMAGYTPTHTFQIGTDSNMYFDTSTNILGLGLQAKILTPSNVWIEGTGGNNVTIGPSTRTGPRSVAIGGGTMVSSNAVGVGWGLGTVTEGSVHIGYNAQSDGSSQNVVTIGRNSKAGLDGVSIGSNAGTLTSQYSVSIGEEAGATSQSHRSVSIGNEAGHLSQSSNCVAIGYKAGKSHQIQDAVAVGAHAGESAQGSQAIAIGYQAGEQTQGSQAISIGRFAAQQSQGFLAIAIGSETGLISQQENAIAIGHKAGRQKQNNVSIAIGIEAGYDGQYANSVAIGYRAGNYNQRNQSIAIGEFAGYTQQDAYSIAVGSGAGKSNQGTQGMAFGLNAGGSGQGDFCQAIGGDAGRYGQLSYAIALGQSSGFSNQGVQSVAIGRAAGGSDQGTSGVAIGASAGFSLQGESGVAIGYRSGRLSQNNHALSIGYASGESQQGSSSVAIGYEAGKTAQNTLAVAIGVNAGFIGQYYGGVAIGSNSGKSNQGSHSVAIGSYVGVEQQGEYSIAIGQNAGVSQQGTYAIAIGASAAELAGQGSYAVAIGYQAGYEDQGERTVALGLSSGATSQGSQSVAVGPSAGQITQGINSVAMGPSAGYNDQSNYSVAIGNQAGEVSQGGTSIAIGYQAGRTDQSSDTIAIGREAGKTSQSARTVSIGYACGQTSQDFNAVAVGYYAGSTNQGENSVAIGNQAGLGDQGDFCVSIGHYAGRTGANHANVICINATNSELSPAGVDRCYIKPIRAASGQSNVLSWNSSTGEITCEAAKTFVIDHPDDKEKYLVHGCLEGPEGGVYYRGRGEVGTPVNLPKYVPNLIKGEPTIQVTPIYNGSVRTLNCSEYDKGTNSFEVFGTEGPFYWTFTAKRCDVNVEPLKADTNVSGDGPYLFTN